jgi:hypothetical protein
MRFPAHFNISLDAQDKADLRATRNAFMASMQGLTEDQQLARARTTASGIREADPYTKALARQVVDAAKARSDVERLKADLRIVEEDLRHGGYRPKDPHWRGAALERKEAIERDLELTHARLVGLAEETFGTAQKKAAVVFRARRQQAAKTSALKEAVAQEEARLEAEDLQSRAAAIAKGRRMAAGKSGRNAGEAQ